MDFSLQTLIKIVISFSLLNVWLLRYKQESRWRGGSARNMHEEFKAYGLPKGSILIIGFLKVMLAILLLVSIWYVHYEKLILILIATLLIGAIAMHLKIKDSYIKSIPALILFCLTVVLYFI